MSDDEQLIKDFKSCTGIEDQDRIQEFLNRANWDLMKAIKLATSQESQKLPSELSTHDVPMKDISDQLPGSSSRLSISDDYFSIPSTSKSRIEFNVYCKDIAKTLSFSLSDNDTVGHVKTAIERESGIPMCQQLISGWPVEPRNDDIKLKRLTSESKIQLSVSENSFTKNIQKTINGVKNQSDNDEGNTLHIYDEVHSKDYIVPYQESTRVLDIKNDMFARSTIPVNQQRWTGWPTSCPDDEMTLKQLGLNIPVHVLSFRSDPVPSSQRNKRSSRGSAVESVAETDSDSYSSNDDEDMQSIIADDLFEEDFTSNNCICSLVPQNFESETMACIQFAVSFQEKYGALHPDFFPGTLEEAFKEACHKPAKDKKLLAVYLHHNKSVLTNVFCSQLLCVEAVLQYLGEHFIVWGWDVTLENNKTYLCHKMQTVLGREASLTVKSTKVEKYPLILIINRARRNTEILSVIFGDDNSDELLSQLLHTVDIFTDQQSVECREEEERTAREMIKVEQDQAYQQSLEVDRAKLEAKRKQEQLELEEQAKIEDARQKEAAKKEAHRRALESKLPPEPDDDVEGITKLRIRIHQDQFLERKFLKTDTLRLLMDFLVVRGYDIADYKVITSFPRRDLTTSDPNSTFEALQLYPQETLRLEER